MKSNIGWSQNDGNTDKDEPNLKEIVKSPCKTTKLTESIKNQLGKPENISKMLTDIENKHKKAWMNSRNSTTFSVISVMSKTSNWLKQVKKINEICYLAKQNILLNKNMRNLKVWIEKKQEKGSLEQYGRKNDLVELDSMIW